MPREERGNSPLRRSENGNGKRKIRLTFINADVVPFPFSEKNARQNSPLPSDVRQPARSGMSLTRTSISLRIAPRTTSVQAGRNREPWWLVLTWALSLFGLWGVVEGEQLAEQPRQEARGWLQLEEDQRIYRERVAPRSPADAATIRGVEQRQRLDLRELQAQQRRKEQIHRRSSREGDGGKPLGRDAPAARRDLDRQRLEMRLQRETLGR